MDKAVEKILRQLDESVILVEGKNDEKALRDIGLTATVFRYGSGPAQLASRVRDHGHVLVLFDFDEEGERKAREIEYFLSSENVEIDRALRKAFKRIFGVKTVEQVPLALERLKGE